MKILINCSAALLTIVVIKCVKILSVWARRIKKDWKNVKGEMQKMWNGYKEFIRYFLR